MAFQNATAKTKDEKKTEKKVFSADGKKKSMETFGFFCVCSLGAVYILKFARRNPNRSERKQRVLSIPADTSL